MTVPVRSVGMAEPRQFVSQHGHSRRQSSGGGGHHRKNQHSISSQPSAPSQQSAGNARMVAPPNSNMPSHNSAHKNTGTTAGAAGSSHQGSSAKKT